MADDDEQSQAELRHEKLKELKLRVDQKTSDLGLAPRSIGHWHLPVRNPGSGLNDGDVWTGPLADEQAEATQCEVDALSSCFTDLQEGIAAALLRDAISGIP